MASLSRPSGSDQAHGGGGAAWVALFDAGRVARIDSSTNRVAGDVTAGPSPAGVATGEASVWVAVAGNAVARIPL